MIWNRPKRFLLNILRILSVIAILMTLIACITFYLWVFKPELINQLDAFVFNNYQEPIQDSLATAKKLKSQEDYEEALNVFNDLFESLKDLGKFDRNYENKRITLKNIIELNILLGDVDKAKKIAQLWSDSDARDLDVQIIQIELLAYETTDHKIIESLYEDLLVKFNINNKVFTSYKKYLLKIENHLKLAEIINRYAKNIEQENFKQLVKNMSFRAYYQENSNYIYQESESVTISDVQSHNQTYIIYGKKRFVDLEKLRFDFEKINTEFEISNIEIRLKGKSLESQSYSIEEIETHSMTKQENGHFLVGLLDPYFSLTLKNEYAYYTGELEAFIRFKVSKKSINNKPLGIENHTEWQLFYTTGDHFTEEQSHFFNLAALKIVDNYILWTSKVLINKQEISQLRIDFPALDKLNIDFLMLNVKTLDGAIKTFDLIKQSLLTNNINHIENNDMKIIGEDPYLVFNLPQKLDIDRIEIILKVYLDGQ